MVISTREKSNLVVWFLLPGRLLLFGGWQVFIALLLMGMGAGNGWEESAAWWPVTAVLTNIVSIFWLRWLYQAEGLRFRGIFRIQRQTVKKDLLFLLSVLVVSGPVAMLPNILAANWLFGSQLAAVDMMFRPLPVWAVLIAVVLWPLTQVFAELPFYFGYLLPRLKMQAGRWTAVLVCAFWLGAQHCALPLIFDGRFILWRLLMFLPFALLVGIVLDRQPRLLPYLVVVHGLLDLTTAVMIPVAVA